ncbi:hypothetical protein RHRU231_330198 [Rhodococcus ruber]|uniref:Uncharacterized protein n=1 Tax=Rhodococcus ruber TaxID=1830 RepID=A0A098BJ75_9NOCA|nr:hypothetical protein RHRU231_330198 [Rhodococcus ruber]
MIGSLLDLITPILELIADLGSGSAD